MGGPTPAIVSEIYMQSLETTAITTADHPPKVWESHVDDVFSTVHKTYLQELLEHVNSLHPQTQFTKEEENDSILPFLDTDSVADADPDTLIRKVRHQLKNGKAAGTDNVYNDILKKAIGTGFYKLLARAFTMTLNYH